MSGVRTIPSICVHMSVKEKEKADLAVNLVIEFDILRNLFFLLYALDQKVTVLLTLVHIARNETYLKKKKTWCSLRDGLPVPRSDYLHGCQDEHRVWLHASNGRARDLRPSPTDLHVG